MPRLSRFEFLQEGERLCGEWLAQAHGTRYELKHEPFVVFDLMRGDERALWVELFGRCTANEFTVPWLARYGDPVSPSEVMKNIGARGFHGAIDPVEGAVWRCERKGKVDFLGKYVRPDKVDGLYLPEKSGQEAVWNWKP